MASLSINIDVGDLGRAVTFYEAAAGLKAIRRLGDFGVELAGAPVPVFLLQKSASAAPFPGAAARRDYGRHWTPVHVDFLVDDIDQAFARAVSAGAAAESEVQSHPWGRMALMADPFGNGFCLIQLEGAGYAAIATPL